MKKSRQSLATSPLLIRLFKSGTGLIEGNYKSDLGMDDIELEASEYLSAHLSDLAGNYLGKYYMHFKKPKEKSIDCKLLIEEEGEVYNPLKNFGDSIYITLLPFESDLGGYAGRFIADFGSPTAEVKKKDLV